MTEVQIVELGDVVEETKGAMSPFGAECSTGAVDFRDGDDA